MATEGDPQQILPIVAETRVAERRAVARRVWPVVLLAAVGLLAAWVHFWAAPREVVAIPGPDATPVQVVTAYLEAVNARDFDTANVIDARPGTDLERFSRPTQTHEVCMLGVRAEGDRVHVRFTADFDGGDATIEDGPWGYYLERRADGLWHITDAGVA